MSSLNKKAKLAAIPEEAEGEAGMEVEMEVEGGQDREERASDERGAGRRRKGERQKRSKGRDTDADGDADENAEVDDALETSPTHRRARARPSTRAAAVEEPPTIHVSEHHELLSQSTTEGDDDGNKENLLLRTASTETMALGEHQDMSLFQNEDFGGDDAIATIFNTQDSYEHTPLSQSEGFHGPSSRAPSKGVPMTSTIATSTTNLMNSSDFVTIFTAKKRLIRCNIHGLVALEPALVAIIDTPQFQRLRHLKQLGSSDCVFPGGVHTRFSHCIGVSHLAGLMVDHLLHVGDQRYEITRRDRLCVKLAGLCHDLGHGPFSHTFETFVNRVRAEEGKEPWEHEHASLQLLDHLLAENPINLETYGLRVPEDVNFIKHLITGLGKDDPWPEDIGRSETKRFLFDIVANKRNGIDVDKLDYFIRDSTATLGDSPVNCDVRRLINSSRVCLIDGKTAICFEQKVALSVLDIFKLRAWLHKFVYQHHTGNLIEEMICDAMKSANNHFHVRGKGGSKVRMSDVVDDMVAYTGIGDWILNAIEGSFDETLEEARTILGRIRRRELYGALGPQINAQNLTYAAIKNGILELVPRHHRDNAEKDLLVHTISIDYGARDSSGNPINPLSRVHFFNPKVDIDKAVSLDERNFSDMFLPRRFGEKLASAYCRNERSLRVLQNAYTKWSNATSQITTLANCNPQSPAAARTKLKKYSSFELSRRFKNVQPPVLDDISSSQS